MKKIIFIILTLSLFLMVACSSKDADLKDEGKIGEEYEVKTFTYESENGPIDLPLDPERIVILDSSAAGSAIMFDGSIVGHEFWTASNPLFSQALSNSTEVASDSLEQILELNPDLIITSSNNENFEELSAIAPTVSFSYGKLNYLDTIIEYGKILNKEEEAQKWVDDFQSRARLVGEKIKDKYGSKVTVSVFEAYGEEIYLFGDNWGRGTQILYQEMGLKMPNRVKEDALEDGYYSISSEVIPEYDADLIVLAYFEGSNLSFKETKLWNDLQAVKNNQILEVKSEAFYMTGPITLDYQLKLIEEKFTK